jgi:hypothetical protein
MTTFFVFLKRGTDQVRPETALSIFSWLTMIAKLYKAIYDYLTQST